jgi:hypothetical protein
MAQPNLVNRPGWAIFSDCRLPAVAAILDKLFDFLPILTCALLDAAQKFFLLAFNVVQIVIGQARIALLDLAFNDVPVALDDFRRGGFEFGAHDVVV